MSTTRQPRATLCEYPLLRDLLRLVADTYLITDTFGGSVWASVPRLVALEKNYTEEELDEKTVDLGKQSSFYREIEV